MSISKLLKYDLHTTTHAAPLALFRVLFGVMMFASIIRFWYHGWIEAFYIEPSFFFSYYGFKWILPLGEWTYLLFFICGLSSLFVAVGYQYRWSMLTFFLSFTYIELIDKTTYLNHYYFISIMSFLMIFLPAAAYYSIDAGRSPHRAYTYIPRWTTDSIKLLLSMVYIFAGLAKLQSDWLVHAMPLKIWLPARYDLPLIGGLLQQEWVHYLFSWGGAGYDLLIPLFLLWRRTRVLAFVAVVLFHVMTRVLFPIGMFPYIMIVSTLIFFDAAVHRRILAKLSQLLRIDLTRFDNDKLLTYKVSTFTTIKNYVLVGFFALQVLLPLRFLLYPGHIFWTEQGYRFSWRVMLMEKAGYANFKIVDGVTGKRFYVDNSDFLTTQQQKMMSTQPDMILEYGQYLGHKFERDGHQQVEVYVESYAALNGRSSQPFIDPDVDLMNLKEGFDDKTWILEWNPALK